MTETHAITLTVADAIGWGVVVLVAGLVAGALAWDAVRTWTGRRR